MKIIYFAHAFEHKPTGDEKTKVYTCEHQYSSDINCLSELVAIYEKGYHFRLEERTDLTNFVVLDIDDCFDGTVDATRKLIVSKKASRRWYCNYSASKSDTKCKVFVWYDEPFEASKENIAEKSHQALEELKKELPFYYDDVELDEHQINNPTQLTFGLPQKAAFVASEFNGLPCKEDDTEYKWTPKVVKAISNKAKVYCFIDDFNYVPKDIDFDTSEYFELPCNKQKMMKFLTRYRPDIYTDYEDGFVNQVVDKWNTYCYRDGKLTTMRFPDGSRHRAIELSIIPHMVESALIMNFIYRQNVTYYDVMANVVKWCNWMMDTKEGTNWINHGDNFTKYLNYVKTSYEDRICSVDWSKCESDDVEDKRQFFIDNYEPFARSICSYKPRNRERMEYLRRFREVLLPYITKNMVSDDWSDISNYIMYQLNCYGNLELIDELTARAVRELKKDPRCKFFNMRLDVGRKHIITKERSDKGGTHKQHKKHKCKYDCNGMSVEEFNTYCKEKNIDRIMKSKLKKKFNIH